MGKGPTHRKVKTDTNIINKPRFKSKQQGKKNLKATQDKRQIGPPSNAADYSIHWKEFLKSQTNVKKISKNKERKAISKINYDNRKRMNARRGEYKRKNVKNTDQKKHEVQEQSEIWFDDVEPNVLERECGVKICTKPVVTKKQYTRRIKSDSAGNESLESVNITRYVALDCEMVGIGYQGQENALARVSLVNSLGECIYDKFVKPAEKVVDYRTEVSGVRPENLKDASDYETVQKEVADILKGRILVGHALRNDLKVLLLSHSRREIRDTSQYKPLRLLLKTKRPALKKLAAAVLGQEIQSGEHSSVIDARVTMEIYQKHKKEWEHSLRMKGANKPVQDTIIYLGGEDKNNKPKNNKWTKIKQRKKMKYSE